MPLGPSRETKKIGGEIFAATGLALEAKITVRGAESGRSEGRALTIGTLKGLTLITPP